MKYKYFRHTNRYYLGNNYGTEGDGDEIYYEPSIDEIKEALTEIIYEQYFPYLIDVKLHESEIKEIKKGISEFIGDGDLYDKLSEVYEGEVYNYFADKV